MGKAFKIAKKEIAGYFSSPVAFLFLGAFLFINLFIFFWVSSFFARNIADVRPLFDWMPVLLIFLVGALTMKMWSEERRAGTVEFLMTLPLSSLQLVLGKFFACLSLVLIALALTLPIPFSVSALGELDWGPVIGAYVASIFLAGAYIAIGLFVSARNDNQIVSLIVTVLLSLGLYFLGTDSLVPLVGNNGAELLQLLGSGSRFESITRGVLDIRDIYYYLSIIGIFLALNVYALEKLRWSETGTSTAPTLWRNLTGLLCLNFLIANFWLQGVNGARIDLTESQMYSISDASRNYISQLQEPLLIRGYFSAKTHPLLAPFVPQVRDLIKEYEVVGDGKIRAEFIDPRDNPELEEEASQKFNIKPVPFQISGKYDVSLVNSYFDILIQYGDKHEVINFQDLIEVKVQGETDLEVKLRNPEYDITKNIKKVMYGFQTTDNLFQSLPEPAVFTGFFSADEKLPEQLRTYRETINTVLGDLSEVAGGKLQVDIRDPENGDGSLVSEIEQQYGFRPMAASIFSNNRFYFYSLLSTKDRSITIPLPEDFTEEGARRSIEAALKRLSPGFLKTVGLSQPPLQMPPQMNPMMMQQPPAPASKTFRILDERLTDGYTINPVDLNSGVVPDAIDLLLVAAPKELSEKGVFALDQFVMKGGTAVLLTSPYGITRTDTELKSEKYDSGLTDWLAHNGISVVEELVLDPQNENYPIPVQRNLGALKVQEIQMVPYPPFIDIRADGMNRDSLITSGVPQVTLNWSSPIELNSEKTANFTITKLLESSPQSWSTPNFGVLPNFRDYPEYGFPSAAPKPATVGLVLEGSFPSYFTGKESPLLADDGAEEPPATPDGEPKEEKGIVSGIIEKSPETAKIVLFSSNEFLADQTLSISARGGGSQFLNSLQLVHNAVDWSLEDRGLLSIRSRGHFSRTLYPLNKQGQLFWEYGNYIASLLGLLIVFFVYRLKSTGKRAAHAALLGDVAKSSDSESYKEAA